MKNKVINKLKNNKQWCILAICLIVFLFILLSVLNNKITAFDTNIYNAIIIVKKDVFTNILKVITEFGSAKILIIISLASLIILKNKRIGIAICTNLASIGLLNQILKNIIQRPRPEGIRIVEESGYSFPSGHSMASMAFYGLIIYFIFKFVKNKTARNTICVVLSTLIFFIGISRIYLGVHYASDVFAGFLISIVYLMVYVTYILKLMGIKEND